MKRVALAVIFCLMLGSSALAQSNFPAMNVVDEVADSVVSIDVNRVVYGSTLGMNAYTHTRLSTTYQTGFVYTENGYIVTDSRNIEDASILTVWLNDGTELEAEFVGMDEEYGVGVIKVETEEPLKPVKVIEGRYDPIEDYYPYDQGDAVVAVGYSGGLGGTVTSGVISSIRNFRNRNEILLPHVIQSDVAINAGNEGCPLFNEQGKVIGMHDLREAGMQNTTFFTPVWLITRVADELIEIYETGSEEEVWHPWLGVKPFAGSISLTRGTYREVGDDLKMYMDIPDQYWDVGVLIDAVWMESPAREFGLLDHDMILDVTVLHVDLETGEEVVKIPYRLIKSVEELEIMVTTAEDGDVFLFGILRNYSYFNLEIEIGQHPGAFTYLSPTSGAQFTPDLEMSSEYF